MPSGETVSPLRKTAPLTGMTPLGLPDLIEFDGTYEQVYRMIDWIEHNEWFTRILRIGAKKKTDVIEGRLTTAILVSQRKRPHGA